MANSPMSDEQFSIIFITFAPKFSPYDGRLSQIRQENKWQKEKSGCALHQVLRDLFILVVCALRSIIICSPNNMAVT